MSAFLWRQEDEALQNISILRTRRGGLACSTGERCGDGFHAAPGFRLDQPISTITPVSAPAPIPASLRKDSRAFLNDDDDADSLLFLSVCDGN